MLVNSERVIYQLKQMSISRSVAGGFNRLQWQQQLGPLLRLWDSLMVGASTLKAALKQAAAEAASGGGRASFAGEKAPAPPVDDFVMMERSHGLNLVQMIDNGLSALGRVLKGQEALSSSVQRLGAALLTEEVPGPWDQAWEGPGRMLVRSGINSGHCTTVTLPLALACHLCSTPLKAL